MKDLGQQLTDRLDAYTYAQSAQSSQSLQQAQQQMNILAAQQAQNIGLQGVYGGGLVKQRSTIVSNMRGVDDPNKREAYAIPLSRLVDMWRIKFEDKWVDVSEIDDEFWADASGRLHRNRLMEEVEFNGSNTPWARLKEDA